MSNDLPSKLAETSRDPRRSRQVSRRQFLKALAGLLGASVAACAGSQAPADFGATPAPTSTPVDALTSPQPPAPAPTASANLARFMALSTVLTGMETLDPMVGQTYLQSIESNPELAGLEAVYEQAGVTGEAAVPALADLEAAGFFDQPATQQLTAEVLKMWFTGVYTENGEPKVATFVDSLAWKTLAYTKPATICGSFGFWALRPPVDV